MSRIQRLDAVVIDQIAAGEVVERPASVVKELIENALDAGATRIEVLLEEGGTRRIEVRDDGVGIAAEDLPLAVSSHATSKLRSPSDLEAIASLGFRGEALASIASVSRLRIDSRERGAEHGASLRVDFGRSEEVREAAAAPGTRIVIEDLFGELPARRKFLKRNSTELAHCTGWVERLALAHLGTGFKVVHGDRVLLDVGAEDDLAERCAAVFGERISAAMLEFERPGEPSVHARIGPPESARRDARRVHLFLNGRWVRDPRLLRAVREGVREFVPIGHYPTLYLALRIAPDRIDVNVHPQKTEVRFRDERVIFGTIVNLLRSGLAKSSWATRAVGTVGSSADTTMPAPGRGVLPSAAPSGYPQQFGSAGSFGGGAVQEGSPVGESSAPTPLAPDSPQVLPLTVDAENRGTEDVVSVANTFLARAVPGGLEIIDQHALHERVNLEELRKEVRSGAVMMQPLLVPALVEVSRVDLDLLLSKAEVLRGIGVDLEAFGETTIALRAIPARLQRLRPESLVDDLLEIAAEQRDATPDALQEEMLHRMACRGAVMAGDRLGAEQLQGLLRRGEGLPQDRTCAHGRPVRVLLSVEDLERAFYRR